jgi:C1A family cysteine protease
MKRGLGWKGYIPSLHDQRYAIRQLLTGKTRPRVVENWFPPVIDQGALGSCGPCAAITLMHSVIVQNNMSEWKMRSPLALYYMVREACGQVAEDAGVDNRIMLSVMAKAGVPSESLWPYDEDRWNVKPGIEAYRDAERHQILEYHLVEGLEEMLQCLAEGYAFIGGMPVYESFEVVGPGGYIPMPGPKEKMLGGHDMYYCGYDDHRQIISGQNSWGKEWGKEGRFFLPYEYAAKALAGCYTITLQEG